MSDNLKYELARELGVDDIVARGGLGRSTFTGLR